MLSCSTIQCHSQWKKSYRLTKLIVEVEPGAKNFLQSKIEGEMCHRRHPHPPAHHHQWYFLNHYFILIKNLCSFLTYSPL